ncbi:UNVERIFIED_CONTAM: hypothetical protein FKN15_073715 [Acipenser sinensis]
MDGSVSVSLFQDELASTIEHAVKAALHTVLCAITEAVGSQFTEFRVEMAGKEKENESLKLRLEISESELKAVLGCINAADADIKQPLIFQDPIESHAIPESEAQEGPKIEAVYTQEVSFEQEWCASLMEVTELTCVKDEEVPQQECVPIKEEFIEQECVPIAEELPHENHVCTLEENNKLGSNLCDDSPSECELGFRGAPSLVLSAPAQLQCRSKRSAILSLLFVFIRKTVLTSPLNCNSFTPAPHRPWLPRQRLIVQLLGVTAFLNEKRIPLLDQSETQTSEDGRVSVSVSFFQDELASTIEHAVKAALNTVLCAITKAVGSKFTESRVEMAGKEKENEMAGKEKENEFVVSYDNALFSFNSRWRCYKDIYIGMLNEYCEELNKMALH